MNHHHSDFLTQALQSRCVLLANHMLSAEPVAMQKLQPHVGKTIKLHLMSNEGTTLNHWLPKPRPLSLVISPAGLIDRVQEAPDATLAVKIAAPTLAQAWQMLREHKQPPMQIEGDAHFAEAVSWVVKNVRWDIAHDLQHWVGTPAVAGLGMIRNRAKKVLMRWYQGHAS